jgi:hypothetical protein
MKLQFEIAAGTASLDYGALSSSLSFRMRLCSAEAARNFGYCRHSPPKSGEAINTVHSESELLLDQTRELDGCAYMKDFHLTS